MTDHVTQFRESLIEVTDKQSYLDHHVTRESTIYVTTNLYCEPIIIFYFFYFYLFLYLFYVIQFFTRHNFKERK